MLHMRHDFLVSGIYKWSFDGVLQRQRVGQGRRTAGASEQLGNWIIYVQRGESELDEEENEDA